MYSGRSSVRIGLIGTWVYLVALTLPVCAQSLPGLDLEQPRPGDSLPPLPELDKPAPQPEFTLPPVPLPPEKSPLSRGPEFLLREVRFEGNDVFTDEELKTVANPFLGKMVAAEDVEQLRRQLTLHYIEAGYVNSGALLPDQSVAAGTITYKIVEGELTNILVAGNERLKSRYLEDRLRRDAGPPLNVNELQQRLAILLEDPLVERIDAKLGPGVQPGESELRVLIEEPPPVGVSASVNNERSPSVGGEQFEGQIALQNFTGNGEITSLDLSFAEGLGQVGGGLSVPLTPWGTSFFGGFDYSMTKVVEEPFDVIDVESNNIELQGGLRQTLYRAPGQELGASLLFNWRESITFLDGRPFSFSEGVEDGKSTVSVIRAAVDWHDRSQDQVFALRTTFSYGFDALGATSNSGSTPDGEFFSWLGQAQWVRRIDPWDLQLVVRGEAQLTPDRLLPLEKFAIGGADTVRGYRENLLVRDNGWDASIEVRVPVWELSPPFVSANLKDGRVELAPFFDIGQSWNTDVKDPDPNTIASIGIGLRWAPLRGVQASLYYGYALKGIEDPNDEDIQDMGIHFAIRATSF